VAGTDRFIGSHREVGTRRDAEDPAAAITALRELASRFGCSVTQNSDIRGSEGGSGVVVDRGKFLSRGTSTTMDTRSTGVHRRVNDGVGRTPGQLRGAREMVWGGTELAHQCIRNVSGRESITEATETSGRKVCTGGNRQFHSSSVFAETRWNKVTSDVRSNEEVVLVYQGKGDQVEGETHSGQVKW